MMLWAAGALGVGLFGFCALLGASEFLVRTRVEPNDHFWRNVAIFFSARSGNVVLGDSIPARGFHGAEGYVNLAMPGEPPVVTELKASVYLNSRTPQNVIISLNPNIFRRATRVRMEQYHDIYVAPREPLLRISKVRHKERMLGYWLVWLSGREFHNNVNIPAAGGIVMRNPAENLAYAKMSPAARRDDAADNVARDMIGEAYREHENMQIIGRIVAHARSKGGKTCLVTFPYSPEYRLAARAYPRFDEVRAYFRGFAAQVGARYVDAWSRYDDTTQFLDPSHLTEDAARRFAPEVVRECFPPG